MLVLEVSELFSRKLLTISMALDMDTTASLPGEVWEVYSKISILDRHAIVDGLLWLWACVFLGFHLGIRSMLPHC